MTLILRDPSGARVVSIDEYARIDDGAELPPAGAVLVTLGRYRSERTAIRARDAKIGLMVRGDVDPDDVAVELADGSVTLVAFEIPKLSDGRAYSLAHLLRDRHGYTGELRATGDVLRDQLLYLARCGFTSFVLKEGRDPADALRAFDDFSVSYQPTADQDQPLWRRARG